MRYTEHDIADRLKCMTKVNKKEILPVLNALSVVLQDMLSDAEVGRPIEIKLCPGVYLESKYVAPRNMRDPRNGKRVKVEARCKVGCKFTEAFRKHTWDRFTEKKEMRGYDNAEVE